MPTVRDETMEALPRAPEPCSELGKVLVEGKVLIPTKDSMPPGHHMFNGGPHLCVAVEEYATISIRLPDGKCVTVSFIPRGPGTGPELECMDIKAYGLTPDNKMHMTGFTPNGQQDLDTRLPGTGEGRLEGTIPLATVLLHAGHYEVKAAAESPGSDTKNPRR